jgi:SPP1 family predicted phage head-tail adaptor
MLTTHHLTISPLTMNIASLRDRLTLEQPLRTPDGGGGAILAWEPVAELWAHIRPLSGDERLRHDRIAGRLTHAVWLRHRPGVVPAMRLRQGARIYDIVAVLDTPRRTHLKCLCEERSL